jgi:hypothetical protein
MRPFLSVTCQFGFLIDKILCSMWLCVYYVAAWCVSHSEGTDDLPEDGTQLPKHVRAAN